MVAEEVREERRGASLHRRAERTADAGAKRGRADVGQLEAGPVWPLLDLGVRRESRREVGHVAEDHSARDAATGQHRGRGRHRGVRHGDPLPGQLILRHGRQHQAALLEDREGHGARAARDADGRRELRDAADAGRGARHLVQAPAIDLETVDVTEPATVRHEQDRAAVRGELRVHVLGAGDRRQHLDAARLCIHDGEAQRRMRQPAEVRTRFRTFRQGTFAIRNECNRRPVRRPGGLQVGVQVICQAAGQAGRELEQVQVADASGHPGEHEPRPVRRPRHRADGADAVRLDAPLDVA